MTAVDKQGSMLAYIWDRLMLEMTYSESPHDNPNLNHEKFKSHVSSKIYPILERNVFKCLDIGHVCLKFIHECLTIGS